MNARRWAAALSSAMLITAVGLSLGYLRGDTHVAKTRAPSRNARLLYEMWPRGQKLTYRFSWQAETWAPVSARDDAGGGLDLDGELVVRGLGGDGDAALLGVSLHPSGRHKLVALGRDLLADGRTSEQLFDGREAIASVGRDGEVRKVWYAKDAPPVWRQLMAGALAQLSMHLAHEAAATWTVDETTPSGEVESRYALDDGEARALLREHVHYQTLTALAGHDCRTCTQELQSQARITLAADGPLAAFRSDESLTVSDGARGGARLFSTREHLDVALQKREPFNADAVALDLDARDANDPNEAKPPEDVSQQLLASRVNGLTMTQLERTLAGYAGATTGRPPAGFVARASGLLIQHPELCARVAALAVREDQTARGRALAIDLLTSAAHPRAQAALRQALASPTVKADPAYTLLVQRVSFVPRPDGETARFVAELRGAAPSGSTLERAATQTLGAVVRGLRTAGDDALARRYDDELRSALQAGHDPDEQRVLLAALGNARQPEDAATLISFTRADDAQLREAAAYALRGSDDGDARARLVALLADPEPQVGVASLTALGEARPSQHEVEAVAALVTAQKTPAGLDDALVGFLAQGGRGSAAAVGALQAMLARTQDVRARGRIQLVLQQLTELAQN